MMISAKLIYILYISSFFVLNSFVISQEYNEARDGFGSVTTESDNILSDPSFDSTLTSEFDPSFDATVASEVNPSTDIAVTSEADPNSVITTSLDPSAASRQTYPTADSPGASPTVNNISIYTVIQESPSDSGNAQTAAALPRQGSNQGFGLYQQPQQPQQQQDPYSQQQYSQYGQPQYNNQNSQNPQNQYFQPQYDQQQQQFTPINNNQQLQSQNQQQPNRKFFH